MLFSELTRSSGIYQILNKINGRFYIGSATNLYERYYAHLSYLNSNEHHNGHLQAAYNKYGKENFEFQILEYCDIKKLEEREQVWLDDLDATKNGYNIRILANSASGIKRSAETRAKMSAWQIGNKLSEETKLRISETLKGRIIEDNVRDRMAVGHRKYEKWPHIQGCACKCDECKEKWNEYHRLRRRSKQWN